MIFLRRRLCSTTRSLCKLLCICIVQGQLVSAQKQTAPATPTSVPPQIAAAHTVFVTNAANDANFPYESNKVLNTFSEKLRGWGRYQLVDSPAAADLVFQIKGVAPITGINRAGPNGVVVTTRTPSFILTITDPKNNVSLWTVTSPVYSVRNKKMREHWEDASETNLVSRVKTLINTPLTTEEQLSLTTKPKTHTTAILLGILGGGVALGLIGYLVVKHADSNNAQSQRDFCTAHGIPLSQCAGA